MASRDDRGSDKGRVKVRVIEFELDGSNQTLRDSIRDIVGAIGGRTQQHVLRAPVSTPAALNGKTAEPAEEGVVIEPEGARGDADEGGENGGSSSRTRRSPPRSPQILDIDFNVGDQPLSSLSQSLKLEEGSVTDRYTVIAWWLKEKLGIEEITQDHIHTGYRHMKWNTPTDAGQPLRNLKTRTYGYMKSGSKPGTYVLTHVGLNHVNDLMKGAGLVS